MLFIPYSPCHTQPTATPEALSLPGLLFERTCYPFRIPHPPFGVRVQMAQRTMPFRRVVIRTNGVRCRSSVLFVWFRIQRLSQLTWDQFRGSSFIAIAVSCAPYSIPSSGNRAITPWLRNLNSASIRDISGSPAIRSRDRIRVTGYYIKTAIRNYVTIKLCPQSPRKCILLG